MDAFQLSESLVFFMAGILVEVVALGIWTSSRFEVPCANFISFITESDARSSVMGDLFLRMSFETGL